MKNRFTSIVLVFTFVASAFLLPAAASKASATDPSANSAEYVLYEEDFDTNTTATAVKSGANKDGAANGWIYDKKSSVGNVTIKDGRMYISGNKYDVLYRDGGETWGNYTLEADFCYTSENTGWGGMLFNVQSGKKFQKVGITPAGNATVNGYNSKWTNDVKSINHYDMAANGLTVPKANEPFRMKVVVFNKTASFYYAFLNEDGTAKTDFIKIMEIDNIPANAQTGSIGFMTSNPTSTLGSFWVDNIKCYSNTLVSFSEDFDTYGDLTLTADATNSDLGVYFEKSNTLASGGAYIENGALHLSGGGKDFNAIFFECGYNWTNYVVESDFTYIQQTKNNGWAGLLFRSNDVDNFWKGAINLTDTASLNCQLAGAWYKNTGHSYDYTSPDYGETHRLRIVVNEKVADLYVAKYTDGVLGEWEYVYSTTDESRFADVHMRGTVGYIVGANANTKEQHICVDNLTVSRIEGTDRVKERTNAADIYIPETGIVNPPVVVQSLTDSLPAVEGERPAVVLAELDGDMNVIGKDGNVLISASEFIDTYRYALIPAFIIDSDAEATALANLIKQKYLADCYVVAEAKNASLVKKVRLANSTTELITGALIFDDLNSPEARKNARALVADNMSYVAISRAPLTEESAFYFALRQVAAWSYADDSAEVYRGIANGYHGIISNNPSAVYDVYESITDATISGKPVIIAHRGANDKASTKYPENTLIGFRASKEVYGVDAIELDFGLTSDGYPIIMHDDTVDRTTNGTGKFSSFTLEGIKALKVDYVEGIEAEVPTLEEAIQLAIELDVVLYCHVKTSTNANIAAFSYLVDKYDAHDRVLLFTGSFEKFNSNVSATATLKAYGNTVHPVVTDKIVFSAGNQKVLTSLTSHLDGVVAMRNCITKYNFQPLFYPYQDQGALWGDEVFYYMLSARGFVNTHSVTDTQATMDRVALSQGAVGYLTNNPQLCDDYHYSVDISKIKTEINLGEAIDTKVILNTIVGSVSADATVIQLDGPTLVSIHNGLTLNENGTVTVVFSAERRSGGGMKYKVYSEPVTITFACFDHKFTKTEFDKSHHWSYCAVCGEIDESAKAEHVFGEWIEGIDSRSRSCECGINEIELVSTAPQSSQPIIIIIIATAVLLSASVFAVIFVKKKKAS